MELHQLAQLNNINLSREQCEKLTTFCNTVLEWNEKFNLTAITEIEEMFFKHIVDCLAVEQFFPINAKVIDVGSGAGFPAVALAIIREDLHITMIDSVNKKVTFLNHCIDTFALNAIATHTRVEDMAKTKRQYFDVATARAVAKLNTLSEYCLPLVKIGGLFLAYKAEAEDEIADAKNAISILGGRISNVHNYSLTNNVEELTRTLIAVSKIKDTPSIYPRGGNKERLKPLV